MTNGHNSVDREVLLSYAERIERVTTEIAALQTDRSELYKAAKQQGYDTKALRQVIRERTMDKASFEEHEMLMDTYRHALGLLADTPLGQAAQKAAKA